MVDSKFNVDHDQKYPKWGSRMIVNQSTLSQGKNRIHPTQKSKNSQKSKPWKIEFEAITTGFEPAPPKRTYF